MNKKTRTFIYGIFLMIIGISGFNTAGEVISDGHIVLGIIASIASLLVTIIGVNKASKTTN